MSSYIEKIGKVLYKNGKVTLIFIGDSITHGLNHCNDEQTYCAVLARLIGGAFPKTKVLRYDGVMQGGSMPLARFDWPVLVQDGEKCITVVRNGVGGDTVHRVLNRSKDILGEFEGSLPDFYFIMLGINDALNDPDKYIVPDGYYSNLMKLYSILKDSNPNAEFVFMTPTYNDCGKTPASSLDSYSDKMKLLAKETDSLLIDTHKLWMKHLIVGSENYGQRDWLSNVKGDSCHFSPKGAEKTAEYIFDMLSKE